MIIIFLYYTEQCVDLIRCCPECVCVDGFCLNYTETHYNTIFRSLIKNCVGMMLCYKELISKGGLNLESMSLGVL